MGLFINKDYIDKILFYNPDNGEIIWKKNNGHHVSSNKRAGWLHNGYRVVMIDGKKYKASRLAWCLMTGEQPLEIDHINGNRSDDRWCNLRNTSKRGNMQNQKKHRNGKLPGFSWVPNRNKFRAVIKINGKNIYIGFFKTEKEANEAYLKKAKELDKDEFSAAIMAEPKADV